MNDPISEIEAEHTRRSVRKLDRAIKRSITSPWRRLTNVMGALAVVAVLLFGAATVVHGTSADKAKPEGATSCPTPFYVQSYTAIGNGLYQYHVWWAFSNGQLRYPYCQTYVSSCYYYEPGHTYSYIAYCAPSGGGGGSW